MVAGEEDVHPSQYYLVYKLQTPEGEVEEGEICGLRWIWVVRVED